MIYVGVRDSSGNREWLPLESTWETIKTDNNGGTGGRLFIGGTLVQTYSTQAEADANAQAIVEPIGYHVVVD